MDKELSIKLYQTITDSNEERVYEAWHASSIAECPRTQYFKRMGVQALTRPSAAMVLRWTAGHNMEEAIRVHLLKIYPELQSNDRMTSTKLDLTGEYDNLVDDTLIEIKTVHDYAFIQREGETYLKEQNGFNARGQKAWNPKMTPYLHHELQQHAYVLLLKEKGVEVKHIKYVYISLSGRIVVYHTDVQQELIDNVLKRLEVLNKAWKNKEVPECICEINHPLHDSVMQWCPYKTEKDCCNIKLLEGIK